MRNTLSFSGWLNDFILFLMEGKKSTAQIVKWRWETMGAKIPVTTNTQPWFSPFINFFKQKNMLIEGRRYQAHTYLITGAMTADLYNELTQFIRSEVKRKRLERKKRT